MMATNQRRVCLEKGQHDILSHIEVGSVEFDDDIGNYVWKR